MLQLMHVVRGQSTAWGWTACYNVRHFSACDVDSAAHKTARSATRGRAPHRSPMVLDCKDTEWL